RSIRDVLHAVEQRGGALACIESGYFGRELADSAYRRTQAVERGERPLVGVNRYESPAEPLEVFEVDPDTEAAQVAAVRAVRTRRDQAAVDRALRDLSDAARGSENVVPVCIEAVRAYATVGEIVAALREVFGPWRPTADY
ncbi:MAG TPA: methylmalonyl-CoA mutase family protein, partial [Micromonosporaceae bacterium]|nr:methylmalonyl-CoA mutase family protein [Micromonosporaceae bacterium]